MQSIGLHPFALFFCPETYASALSAGITETERLSSLAYFELYSSVY